MEALKEFLLLVNEEELKQARFFILFNYMEEHSKTKLTENDKTEYKDKAIGLISLLKQCPIQEYDARIEWEFLDIMKLNETDSQFLRKCFIGKNPEDNKYNVYRNNEKPTS